MKHTKQTIRTIIKDPVTIFAIIPRKLKHKYKSIAASNGIKDNDFINLALQKMVDGYYEQAEKKEENIIEK